MDKAITQHYWPEREGQAEHLKQYIEARKRERRLSVVPKTQAETEELVRRMALVGIPVGVLAAGGILFLLITHFGWWTVPVLGSVAGLRYLWEKVT